MFSEHKELFENFRDIHDSYTANPPEWQKLFNQYGREVVEIIREHERRLCANSEKGMYGKFSDKLSQKFWDEVRKEFPKIDFVGVTVG